MLRHGQFRACANPFLCCSRNGKQSGVNAPPPFEIVWIEKVRLLEWLVFVRAEHFLGDDSGNEVDVAEFDAGRNVTSARSSSSSCEEDTTIKTESPSERTSVSWLLLPWPRGSYLCQGRENFFEIFPTHPDRSKMVQGSRGAGARRLVAQWRGGLPQIQTLDLGLSWVQGMNLSNDRKLLLLTTNNIAATNGCATEWFTAVRRNVRHLTRSVQTKHCFCVCYQCVETLTNCHWRGMSPSRIPTRRDLLEASGHWNYFWNFSHEVSGTRNFPQQPKEASPVLGPAQIQWNFHRLAKRRWICTNT